MSRIGLSLLIVAFVVRLQALAARDSELSTTHVLKALSERQRQINSAYITVYESPQHGMRITTNADQRAGKMESPSAEVKQMLMARSRALGGLLKPKRFTFVVSANHTRLEEWRPTQMGDPLEDAKFHQVGVFDGKLGKALIDEYSGEVTELSDKYPLGTIDDTDISHALDLVSLSPLAVATRPLRWMERNGFDPSSDSIEVYRESFRDSDCAVIRWRNPNGVGVSHELWAASVGAGAPRRIIASQKGRIISQIDVTEVASHAGCDVPIRWVFTRYGSGGKVETALQSIVTDVALNEPIESKRFVIEFPPGTLVTDLTSSTVRRFIVREGKPARQILDSELRAGVPYSQLLNTEPRQVAARQSAGRSAAVYLSLVVVIVVVVLVARRHLMAERS